MRKKLIPGCSKKTWIYEDGRVYVEPYEYKGVSPNGRVYTRKRKGRFLKTKMIKHGLVLVPAVVIFRPYQMAVAVHSLVARAFLPGNGRGVRFKDGNVCNSHVSNLERFNPRKWLPEPNLRIAARNLYKQNNLTIREVAELFNVPSTAMEYIICRGELDVV